MHPVVESVTQDIIRRSQKSRDRYLKAIAAAKRETPARNTLSCGNLAHGFAACSSLSKSRLSGKRAKNVAIVSAFNEMLSAHQPYGRYPELIKQAVAQKGEVAQFAGGVPAMCDGVTQGQAGMELSLFSRDLIAMSTAVALSHNMFDAAVYLGICDKIVPGLLIGALSFGHLPGIFIPSGPMPSGLPNAEKAAVRQRYADGKASREELLQAESQSYHSPGTCTFYGTANSNQMLMEIMGLQLPGSAFVAPDTPLRDALTVSAAQQVLNYTAEGEDYRPLGQIVDEKAIVNAVVGLLATGGSTNHTLHLPAIARAAGIQLTWADFSSLSEVVPSIAKIYPNGLADINHFQAAGGMSFVVHTLLSEGLIHADSLSVAPSGDLAAYTAQPCLHAGAVAWQPGPTETANEDILRPVPDPFEHQGGLKLLKGNIGTAIVKTSAVDPKYWQIQADAVVFENQSDFVEAFQKGALNRDFIAVLRFQGPKANGMPELHKLTPLLGVLQDKGFRVALMTDGRMSGASGKVLAAIHLSPEAMNEGPISRIQDGDPLSIDVEKGEIQLLLDAEQLAQRPLAQAGSQQYGMGRELFKMFRDRVGSAEEGASCVEPLQ